VPSFIYVERVGAAFARQRLNIDKILVNEEWRQSIISGKGRFPKLPIDYGFRDNRQFWISSHSRPYPVQFPKKEGIQVDIIKNFADNINPNITWDTESYRMLSKIPRSFPKKALPIIVKKLLESDYPVPEAPALRPIHGFATAISKAFFRQSLLPLTWPKGPGFPHRTKAYGSSQEFVLGFW